jgi:alpha-methylacyl-CoA racemase
MVDGSATLMALMYGLFSQGLWKDERGANMLDSGAPWYNTYRTKDGKWLAVGAIEKRFYAEFLERLRLDARELPRQHDRKGWPDLHRRFAEIIAGKTRAEWERIFEGSDACVAPVLSLGEVASHPHNAARRTFAMRDDVLQPAPAPRFSRTEPELGPPPGHAGADTDAVLAAFGYSAAEIASLKEAGAVGSA